MFSCWLLTIWVCEDCNSKCSCLCCVGVLFLSFCCPFWFLWGCGGCVLPGREFFSDSDRHCQGRGILVKCVSVYWELRNREGLGGMRESTGGRNSGCNTRMCFSPLGIGPRVRRGTRACWKPGAETGVLDLEEVWEWRSETHPPSLAYVLFWQACLAGSQEVPAEAGHWNKAMSWGKGVWRRLVWSTDYAGRGNRGDHSKWSATEPGMRVGEWIWRSWDRNEDLYLAYQLRWPGSPVLPQVTSSLSLWIPGQVGEKG